MLKKSWSELVSQSPGSNQETMIESNLENLKSVSFDEIMSEQLALNLTVNDELKGENADNSKPLEELFQTENSQFVQLNLLALQLMIFVL